MSVENKSSRGGAAAEAALVVVINIHTTNNDGWMAPVKKQKTKLFFIASNVTSHIRLQLGISQFFLFKTNFLFKNGGKRRGKFDF